MVRKIPDIIGLKYNDLTIIGIEDFAKEYKNSTRTRLQVLVKCDCGHQFSVTYQKLKTGQPKSCRACAYKKLHRVQVGEVFDKLTVIGYTQSKDGRSLVQCQCQCGTKVNIRVGVLLQNQTNNCGCARRGRWFGVEDLSATFFYRIKRGAKIRNLDFEVTMEYLWDIYIKQGRECALTGVPISFNVKTTGKNTASLDRIDSSKGYLIGNVQWVHKNINIMKREIPQLEFIQLCQMVAAKYDSKSTDVF